MTTAELRTGFKISLDARDEGSYDLFIQQEIDFFISQAIRQFYARRLSGLTSDRTSFEQWQKRSDDMSVLYREKTFDNIQTVIEKKKQGQVDNNVDVNIEAGLIKISFPMPIDYWHMMNEDCIFESDKYFQDASDRRRVFDVYECTTDNLTKRLRSRLSPHHFRAGEIMPLRVITGEEILSPSVFKVNPTVSTLYYKEEPGISFEKYRVGYLKKPDGFGQYSSLYKIQGPQFDAAAEIKQVPDHAWDEVLSLAVGYALENVESARTRTYTSQQQMIQ